jgi:diguanylate cyclase (GGDEF)-like protein
MLWVICIELPLYREGLLLSDQRLRASAESVLPKEELHEMTRHWMRQLGEWVSQLADCPRGTRGHELVPQIEEWLLDQSYEVKSVCDEFARLTTQEEHLAHRQEALKELGRLVMAANTLRDQIVPALATILRKDGRVGTLNDPQRVDTGSRTTNRLGLECLVEMWRDGGQRGQPASAVLIDLDRMARVNERWGHRAGDNTIAAAGRLFKTLIRQQRSFDHVTRYTGTSFLVLLGETSASQAKYCAERARQTLEAASFKIGSEQIELTASGAIAEIGREESFPDFLARLEKILAEAKNAGRNQTYADHGAGPEVVQIPQPHIRGTVIDVVDAF